MSDIYSVTCEECGNVSSAHFGVARIMSIKYEEILKKEIGNRAYEQFKEILDKCEKKVDFDIEDYDCFEIERVYDLEYKRNRLIYSKKSQEDSFAKFRKMYEGAKDELSSESKKFAEDLTEKYTSYIKILGDALESGDAESIHAAYNKKVAFVGENVGYRIFICPECKNIENKFYTGVKTGDCDYALKSRCPECNAKMISYKSFGQAIEEGNFHCLKCGSNKLIKKHELHLD